MFSLFNAGLRSKRNSGNLSFSDLLNMIREHPDRNVIRRLHRLAYKSNEYNRVKESLPCLTPHGLFNGSRTKAAIRELSDIFYFDIDASEIQGDIVSYKQHLISTYGHHATCIGLSVGGRGVFIYIRVNGVSINNFSGAFRYVADKVLTGLPIDTNATGISRCQVIPYDPYVYYNPAACVDIPADIPLDKVQKIIKGNEAAIFEPYIPIRELLRELILETPVDTDGQLFKIDPVNYYKVFLPRSIKDGRKHTTFRAMTQGLMYLNVNIGLHQVLSYINFVNQHFTTAPMLHREMVNTVTHEYNRVVETGEITIPFKLKTLHFHKSARLEEKRSLAPFINGQLKKLQSTKAILAAVNEIECEGMPSYKDIAAFTGLSIKTVRRNIDNDVNQLVEGIMRYNRKIE